MNKLRKTSSTLLILWVSFGLGTTYSLQANEVSPNVSLRANDPCGQKEVWSFGGKVPEKITSLLNSQKDSQSESAHLANLAQSYLLRSYNVGNQFKLLLEYMIYRTYYHLGLVHFSQRGFHRILTQELEPKSQVIGIAVLGCLNRIHKEFPSLALSEEIPKAASKWDLKALSPDETEILWRTTATVAARKIAAHGSHADLSLEGRLLQGAKEYLQFIQVLKLMAMADDEKIEAYGKKLLQVDPWREAIEAQRNSISLNMARSAYSRGDDVQAAVYFKQVNHESNYFPQASLGLAWAYLGQNRPELAIGPAYNLIVGEMKNTFFPSAPIVAAIAYYETCHYDEAKHSIAYFRKNYDKSYRWLYQWFSKERSSPQTIQLYSLLINDLKQDSKKKVPANILAEWVRSPVFQVLQQELNLLVDEKNRILSLSAALKSILKTPSKDSPQIAKLKSQITQSIMGVLLGFNNEIPKIRTGLVSNINRELAFMNRYLIKNWVEAYENSHLVEAEIFNAVGDMARARVSKKDGKADSKASSKKVLHDSEGLPVLDWGDYPIDNEESAEVWEDEIGYLRANIESVCEKK